MRLFFSDIFGQESPNLYDPYTIQYYTQYTVLCDIRNRRI